jgi:hypothetical protein
VAYVVDGGGVPYVSPEVTTVVLFVLAGCAVGGGIGVAGVLLGLLAARRLRERARVRCVATDWQLEFQKGGELHEAVCSFELDLFNETQLATGLRGVWVALYGEDEKVAIGRLRDPTSKEPLWTIDLPSRRWTHASAYVVFEDEEARMLSGFRRADLLARFPDGRVFKLTIVERQDFVASPKKVVPSRQEYVANRNFYSRLRGRRRTAG